ncbi:hypothetical protein ACGFZA_12430 [Streptomyces sp. NPDC048211]|uniref:hypothetical protein n=1 Tax=Streptomyces sp. NPDC048211 TaxID=3365516 RepID=UPI00371BF403
MDTVNAAASRAWNLWTISRTVALLDKAVENSTTQILSADQSRCRRARHKHDHPHISQDVGFSVLAIASLKAELAIFLSENVRHDSGCPCLSGRINSWTITIQGE